MSDVERNTIFNGEDDASPKAKRRGRRPKRWSGFGSRKQLKSRRWHASYEDPSWTGDGRAPRINAPHTFRTQGESEAWLTKIGAEVAAGTWKHPDLVKAEALATQQRSMLENMTVTEWSAVFLEYGREQLKWATKTNQQREGHFRNHIRPVLGHMRIIDVTDENVSKWYAGLSDGVKATCYQTLNAMMNYGVKSKQCPLTDNPCAVPRGGKPIRVKPPKYLFSDSEVDRIADAIYPRGYALLLLEADAGLRINEALALTRDCLELNPKTGHGVVHVLHSLQRENGALSLGDTKTHRSRHVRISRETVEALVAHLKHYTGPRNDSPVFTTSAARDSFMRDSSATRWLDTAMKRAGVKIPKDRSGGWHAFRHYSATRFGQAGATTAALLDRYGWMKPEMAMRYQRQDGDYQQEIVNVMAERRRARTESNVSDLDELRKRKHA